MQVCGDPSLDGVAGLECAWLPPSMFCRYTVSGIVPCVGISYPLLRKKKPPNRRHISIQYPAQITKFTREAAKAISIHFKKSLSAICIRCAIFSLAFLSKQLIYITTWLLPWNGSHNCTSFETIAGEGWLSTSLRFPSYIYLVAEPWLHAHSVLHGSLMCVLDHLQNPDNSIDNSSIATISLYALSAATGSGVPFVIHFPNLDQLSHPEVVIPQLHDAHTWPQGIMESILQKICTTDQPPVLQEAASPLLFVPLPSGQ